MIAADLVDGLLRTNLAAGAAILVVMALRKAVRSRFGARLAYGLWLLPVLTAAAVLAPARQIHIVRSAAPALAAASGVRQSLPAAPAAALTNLDPLVLLAAAWLAGALGAALVMAHLQLRFLSRVRRGAVGPALVGVMTPRIVTPKDFAERFSEGEQALVLAHERAHLARQDSRLNGLCALSQCLCWFNPLVHLAAHLMRVDQELACDETVVTRFPDARRAYAEVLVKAQLATLPLPLGCYWPSKAEHPLVERIAMLKHKQISGGRRSAGVAALVVLCAGASVAAWASQPPDVRVAIGRADEVRTGQAQPARVIAPRPLQVATLNRRGLQRPDEAGGTADPVASSAGQAAPEQSPADTAPAADPAPLATALIDAQPPAATSAHPLAALFSPTAQPTLAPAGASARPAASDTGEANCYPVFGELRCDRLSSAQTGATAKPQAAGPPIVVAALAIPAPPVSSATSRPPAVARAKIDSAYQIATSDELNRIICETRPVTGSRFRRHVCMTKADWRFQRSQLLSFERLRMLDPTGDAAGDN